MSLSDQQWTFLQNVAKLISYAHALGYKLTGGELYRPQFVQDRYFEEGKTHTLKSDHKERKAIDFNLFVDGEIQWHKNEHWELLGLYWKKLDEKNYWGGDWKNLKDHYHFGIK